MSFLYPYFLLGLFAIAIPIIIHLFNFQRPKEVFFTNVRFLRNIQQATSSRLKLKHLLILFARIAFLTFLVLAFAQPVMKGKNTDIAKGGTSVSLYVDNSFSMENEVEGERAFDAALNSVKQLTDVFANDSKYLFLTNDFEGGDQFFKNKDKLKERITEVDLSGTFRSADGVLNRQSSILAREATSRDHIFWFSDFQRSNMGDLSKIELDSTKQYHLVPFQNKEVYNVFVDSVWLEEPLVRLNENNRIKVQLFSTGKESVDALNLKLFLDDVQVSTASVDIPANGKAITELVFNVNTSDSKQGVIRFEDQPIRFDNEYFFVLDVASKVNIYHLTGEGGNYVRNVFGNEKAFNVTSTTIGEIDYSMINTSDLIILDGIRNFPSSLYEQLNAYLSRGGNVVVIPSATPDLASYSKIFPSISPTLSNVSKESKYYELASPDLRDPFYKDVFERADKNVNMPYGTPVLDKMSAGRSLLRYRNGESFLSVYAQGAGKLYIFRSAFDGKTSNFPKHALFVPVMYKIGFGSYANYSKMAYSFQENTIPVKVNAPSKNEIYHLKAEQLDIIPVQRTADRMLYLEVPKEQMKAGFFSLTNGKDERMLAFNYGKEESLMDFYSIEELKELFKHYGNVKVYEVKNSDDFYSQFKNDNIGISLWKYCLILGLFFLMLEILLIRFL